MKGHILFFLPSTKKLLKQCAASSVVWSECICRKYIFLLLSSSNNFWKYQTTVQKNIQGDNQDFHSWVASISSLPEDECRANHTHVYQEKQPVFSWVSCVCDLPSNSKGLDS